MAEESDKREHSTKPEVDDLTDYQSLNSLGGAGVSANPEAFPPPTDREAEEAIPLKRPAADGEADEVIEYSGDYNDGADFTTVDNKGRTNT